MNSNDSLAIDGLIARLSKKGIQLDCLPAAIYARKSTKDETQISLESQIDYCKKYIGDDSRLRIIKTYSEDKISGYHIEGRKQYSALLEEVRKGNIRVIIYYALDRESRNTAEAIALDSEMEKLGVLQIYATQSFTNDANGRFVKTVIRADAQRQVEFVSERVLLAMEKTAKSTKSTGGKTLYGYKIVDNRYVVNDKEKEAVKLAFDLALAGNTISNISVRLAQQGYYTRQNTPFPVNTLWNMLRNEKYTGQYIYFKKNARKRKGRVSNTEVDEIRIKGGIPQIITEETFKKVQSVLENKTNKTCAREHEDYLLRGYIFCGESGKAMHGELSYGGDSRLKYARYTTPRKDSVKRSIRKETIESATAEVLASILNKIKKDYVDISKLGPSLSGYLTAEIARITSESPRIRKELMSSVNALPKLSSEDTVAIVMEEIKRLQEVLNNMERRKKSLESQLRSLNSGVKTILINGLAVTGEDLLNNPELYKKSLNLYIKEIKVFVDKVEYNLKELA